MTGWSAQIRRSRPLLGTFVEIALGGAEEPRLHRAADRAFTQIERIQRLMSRFDPDSDVCRLNREAAAREVRVDAHTWQALALAREVADASNGAFDITVPASAAGCEHGCDSPGRYDDIELMPGSRVRFRRRLNIDLGGIAKGYAVDVAVACLAGDGKRNGSLGGSINAGGDLRVFGGCDRHVSIRDPQLPFRAGAVVVVRDRAIATSASYPPSARYGASGRVIDANGARVPCGRSATVRASRCAVADALAKALLLLGDRAAAALARYDAHGFLLDSRGLQMVGRS